MKTRLQKSIGENIEPNCFPQTAQLLLNSTRFIVLQQSYRLLEIEFYYYSDQHPDPFTHCDPLQKTSDRWYFHRDGGSYRGGSFKGLDISFGPENTFGGILIRTIAADDGTIINGCSLCVDHLLAQTQFQNIAALDEAINERSIWDKSSPLHLEHLSDTEPTPRKLIMTPRVGLTLKRMSKNCEMPRYIMRPYRFLTEPAIKKGKVYNILALYNQGNSIDDIKKITNSPLHIIKKYVDAFHHGQSLKNFDSYQGKFLTNTELCSLYGTVHPRTHGEHLPN
ncbi:MAG: hypothetical protein DRR19_19680 [Candidatus Parabeggiatoa sp. nov. 1]|nr:MAG: hypothetical protein DRR19_19680 [Gammaproteobacteria bacterium]